MKKINQIKYIIFALLLIVPLNVKAAIKMTCDPVYIGKLLTCYVKSDRDPVVELKAKIKTDTSAGTPTLKASGNFAMSNQGTNYTFVNVRGGVEVFTIKMNIPSDYSKTTLSLDITEISLKASQNDAFINSPNINLVLPVTKAPAPTPPAPIPAAGEDKTFIVTFNSNNEDNNLTTQSCTTKGSNCKIPLSNVKIPIKEGFIFNGWGNGGSCNEGSKDSYTATSSTTLYACWAPLNIAPSGPTSNLYLRSLSVEGQELKFSKFKKEYELVVLFQIENLVIKAAAEPGAVIELADSYPLEVGDNTILLTLVDEDDKTDIYTIKVKRLKEGEEIKVLSSDATLKSLKISKYPIEFDSAIFEYKLKVSSSTKKLDIKAVTNNEDAEFLISGNSELQNGSIVKVTVKAEDGTINSYNIYIEISKGIMGYLVYILLSAVLLTGVIALIVTNKDKSAIKQKKSKKINSKAPKKSKQTKSKSKPSAVVNVAPVTPVAASPVEPVPVNPAPLPDKDLPVKQEPVAKPATSPVEPVPVIPALDEKPEVEVLDL